MKKIILLIYLFNFCICNSNELIGNPCNDYFTYLLEKNSEISKTAVGKNIIEKNKEVFIKKIPIKGKGLSLNKQSFYNDKSLYLGVTNHKGNEHFYLVAGSKRYDGFIFENAKVSNLGKNILIPKGVIFKIDLPENIFKKIEKSIEQNKNKITISCFHGLCDVLKDAGIKLPAENGWSIQLKPVLNGLINSELSEIKNVSMYATSIQDLEHFLKKSETLELSQIAMVRENHPYEYNFLIEHSSEIDQKGFDQTFKKYNGKSVGKILFYGSAGVGASYIVYEVFLVKN